MELDRYYQLKFILTIFQNVAIQHACVYNKFKLLQNPGFIALKLGDIRLGLVGDSTQE